ncbi:MAG: hypothetical protein Q9168_007449 [Polycauliona sp. 1 TL-2023]
MLAKIALSLLLASVAIGDPHGHPWQHPLPTDRKALITDIDFNARQLNVSLGRSPCPAVNALANHGYLPRNGLNVSLEQFIAGFDESLNFDAEFVVFAVDVYTNFTTTGNNNTLNLNDLDHHAIPGEHDGSLSRNDIYFGDNHSFNKKIWNTVAANFHDDTISLQTAGMARRNRFAAAEAINPKFTPSVNSSLGETALYHKAMQGQNNATRTDFVRILFNEERIPYNEGYKKSSTPISNKIIGDGFLVLFADLVGSS